MIADLWSRLAPGLRVLVAGSGPDRLFGVRDGFRRYFVEGMRFPAEVRVEGREVDDGRDPLPLEDEDILRLALQRARELPTEHCDFRLGTEAGLLAIRIDDEERWMVRTWTVVCAFGEEAWGSSGSIQLPRALIEGLDASDLPFHVPGARRQGGMVGSLTSGLERRRDAVSLSTVHALSSLFYPFLEGGEGKTGPRELFRVSPRR